MPGIIIKNEPSIIKNPQETISDFKFVIEVIKFLESLFINEISWSGNIIDVINNDNAAENIKHFLRIPGIIINKAPIISIIPALNKKFPNSDNEIVPSLISSTLLFASIAAL